MSNEFAVKVPWSGIFCDGKSIFWSNDANQAYGIHPETIAYEEYINRFRLNADHIPNTIYTMKIPILVHTNPMTISSIESSFNLVLGEDKNNPMQKVLILLLTGLRDNFSANILLLKQPMRVTRRIQTIRIRIYVT